MEGISRSCVFEYFSKTCQSFRFINSRQELILYVDLCTLKIYCESLRTGSASDKLIVTVTYLVFQRSTKVDIELVNT
jgi:hypothetical protein